MLCTLTLTATACGIGSDDTQTGDTRPDAAPTTSPANPDHTGDSQEDNSGQDNDSSEQTQPATPSSLPPGPVITEGVHPTDLVVSCSENLDYITGALSDADGEVVEPCNDLSLLRVRFPVASIQDLLDVRDSLRSVGLDAAVIPALDPGDLGTGTEDDPS